MKSIKENKFGMFIHWGIYSQLGLQEQAIARYDMDSAEYEKLATTFNPVNYDPERWVLLAKQAGMKYICFTTKHHDGFCMWDTKYTDYNIMNTPYGKDVLGELAIACEKHGMLLSLYYSCPDWHYEYGRNPHATHQWKAKPGIDLEKFVSYVKNQITELLTNYGKIYTLFWDIPPRFEERSINELVRKLQPGIYINNRGFDEGDFSTPERGYKDVGSNRFENMTEACNAVGEQSWGYRENEDYHSIRYLTMAIDKIMAMGGSYLLNAGPKPDGTIDEKSAAIIRRVGDWYNRMEGCLEEADEDTFAYKIRKYKYIATKKNRKSYFHFFNGISSSAIAFEIYPSVPQSVRLMNTGEELPFEVCKLPEYLDDETGIAKTFLHIQGIPIDELESEPIVLEIKW